MVETNSEDLALIRRYARLAIKNLLNKNGSLTPEMSQIQKKLNMSHDEIITKAFQTILNDTGENI